MQKTHLALSIIFIDMRKIFEHVMGNAFKVTEELHPEPEPLPKSFSIGEEDAIKLHNTKWWTYCTQEEIAAIQIMVREVITPFKEVFIPALKQVLGHEFTSLEEFLSDKTKKELMNKVGKLPRNIQDVIDILQKYGK